MKKTVHQRFNIGVLLILFSVALVNLLNAYTMKKMSFLSDVLMIIGLLLIFSNIKIRENKLKLDKQKTILLVYSFCIFFWSLIADYSWTQGTGAIIFNAFEFCLAALLFCNDDWENSDDFPRILFYFSNILCILSTIVLTDWFKNTSVTINGIYSLSDELISDRLTLSTFPLYSIASIIIYKSNNKKEILLKCLFLFMSMFNLLIVNRRGIAIELAIGGLIVFMRSIKINTKKHVISKNTVLKIIISIFFLVIAFAVIRNNSFIMNKLNNFTISIDKSVKSLIGNNDSTYYDAAGNVRYETRQNILNEYKTFTSNEIIFGKGYMYRQLDFPFLQAFIDGGLIYGIIFFIIMAINPLIQIFRQRINNDMDRLFVLLLIISILNCLFTGIPYGQKITYLLFAYHYFFVKDKNKYIDNKEQTH